MFTLKYISELLFGNNKDEIYHLTPDDNVYIDDLCMGATDIMRVKYPDMYKIVCEPYINLKHTCSHGMEVHHFAISFIWSDGDKKSTIVDANSYCNVIRFMDHHRNSDKYIVNDWISDDLIALCDKYALPQISSNSLYFAITHMEQIRNCLANHILDTLKNR